MTYTVILNYVKDPYNKDRLLNINSLFLFLYDSIY